MPAMENQSIERLAFVVSEVYERKELLNKEYMLKELRACSPSSSEKALIEVLSKAKRYKWNRPILRGVVQRNTGSSAEKYGE